MGDKAWRLQNLLRERNGICRMDVDGTRHPTQQAKDVVKDVENSRNPNNPYVALEEETNLQHWCRDPFLFNPKEKLSALWQEALPRLEALVQRKAPRTITVKVKGVDFKFVEVKGGTLVAGMTRERVGSILRSLKARTRLSPLHDAWPPQKKEIQTFWMLQTTVNELQWAAVMEPEVLKSGKLRVRPKVGITWDQAAKFAELLGRLYVGKKVQLPTEFEFEWAAQQFHPTGRKIDDLKQIPNCRARAGRGSMSDVHLEGLLGTVWQHTRSPLTAYTGNDMTEQVPDKMIVRGGCDFCAPDECLPSSRWYAKKYVVDESFGFRVMFY